MDPRGCTAPIRRWSSTTPLVDTPALSKTCSIGGNTTPAVAVSSVAAGHHHHHHSTIVDRSPGLSSALCLPSYSDSGDWTTFAGVFLAMRGRSSSWAGPSLQILLKWSLATPALPALICLIGHSKCLYLY